MLQITDNQGIFQLTGNLVAGSTDSLSRHISLLLDKREDVVLNLDQIDSIDKTGINISRNKFFIFNN